MPQMERAFLRWGCPATESGHSLVRAGGLKTPTTLVGRARDAGVGEVGFPAGHYATSSQGGRSQPGGARGAVAHAAGARRGVGLIAAAGTSEANLWPER